MEYQEPDVNGVAQGINWTYSSGMYKEKYRGYLYTEHERIGNLELRLLDDSSSDNLGPHYLWYSLSDFYIEPKFRGKGFGKIMLERAKNFARIEQIAIVKRLKTAPVAEHKLDDLVCFLASHGFQKFEDKTFYYTHDGKEVRKC